jgi:hypothetical protein
VRWSEELPRRAKAKCAAWNAQAATAIEQHKARMHEVETAGLLRTLARTVRRAATKPADRSH